MSFNEPLGNLLDAPQFSRDLLLLTSPSTPQAYQVPGSLLVPPGPFSPCVLDTTSPSCLDSFVPPAVTLPNLLERRPGSFAPQGHLLSPPYSATSPGVVYMQSPPTEEESQAYGFFCIATPAQEPCPRPCPCASPGSDACWSEQMSPLTSLASTAICNPDPGFCTSPSSAEEQQETRGSGRPTSRLGLTSLAWWAPLGAEPLGHGALQPPSPPRTAAHRKTSVRLAHPASTGPASSRKTVDDEPPAEAAEAAAPSTDTKSSPRRIRPASGPRRRCAQCQAGFYSNALLEKHVRTRHRRPFTCVFHFAGCPSTFATKNEWKRHVTTQHLALTYWLCTHEACSPSSPTATGRAAPSTGSPRLPPRRGGRRSASLPAPAAVFTRKDLYTQHVRRMHPPPSDQPLPHSQEAGTTSSPLPHTHRHASSWDCATLHAMQDAAVRRRCHLPSYMRCPAPACGSLDFRGPSAWDDRMEHVARHLLCASAGIEPPLRFGGRDDPTLVTWAEGVGVIRCNGHGWALCNPFEDERWRCDHHDGDGPSSSS